MRLYFEVSRRGFRRYSTYVGATAAGVFTNTVFGFIKAYVLIALFRARGELGGYVTTDAVTYNFVTQGLIATVAVWGWFEVEERIRSGQLATDLLRPYSFLGYWFAHDAGRALYQALARGIPPFLVAAVFFELRLPTDALTWLLFFASVGAAVAVSFAIRFLVNAAAFWLLDSRGMYLLVMVPWVFFSGLMLPLAAFPRGLRTVARALPFAATFDAPAQIFLEKLSGWGIAATLGGQALWALVVLAFARGVLALGTRKLVIQGG